MASKVLFKDVVPYYLPASLVVLRGPGSSKTLARPGDGSTRASAIRSSVTCAQTSRGFGVPPVLATV